MGGIALAAALLGGGGLSVSVSPPSSSGGGLTGGHTSPVTAIVAGAVGAVTFAWTQISGDSLTINSPASATTDFDFTPHPGPGDFAHAVVRVTATNGANSAHADVDVAFRNRSTA